LVNLNAAKSRKHKASNRMSQYASSSSSSSSSMFDGVKVSKGFIGMMQQQVLNLERNQQNLISQLEHANTMAREFHETAVMYHRKYDNVLYEMETLTRKHEMEKQLLLGKIERAEQDAQREREIRQIYAEQIEHLERQVAQQVNSAIISQATTIPDNEYYGDQYPEHEILTPVSVASPSPRASRHGQDGEQSPRLDPETPTSDTDDEDAYNAYYDERNRSPQSSQTTDCSGDPICHSDKDSD
jgi:hypothetical protein